MKCLFMAHQWFTPWYCALLGRTSGLPSLFSTGLRSRFPWIRSGKKAEAILNKIYWLRGMFRNLCF